MPYDQRFCWLKSTARSIADHVQRLSASPGRPSRRAAPPAAGAASSRAAGVQSDATKIETSGTAHDWADGPRTSEITFSRMARAGRKELAFVKS
jgi:hypothetical protein